VETTKPLDNSPFINYDRGQVLEGVGNETSWEFYGYAICIKVDIRFILDDPSTKQYHLRVSADNKIIATMPAWDYNHLKEHDLFAAAPKCGQVVVDAIDNSIDDFIQNKGSQEFCNYRLVFPTDHRLSSKTIYEGATEDEWLEPTLFEIEWKHTSGVKGSDWYTIFKVVDRSKGSRKKGKPTDSNALSDMAKQLQALGIKTGATGSTPMNTGN
jgi:hypothetical protein